MPSTRTVAAEAPVGPQALPHPFEIAFVCTGNRFRSVLAAAAVEAAVGTLPVRVRSYGTLDVGPLEPLPEAVGAARAFGLDISAHVACCLVDADLADVSLVVGFEAAHAVAAVEVALARRERVFVLPELVETLDRIGVVGRPNPVRQALESVARADAYRRSEPRRRISEIRDPIGLSPSAQRAIAAAVHRDATRLAEALFGADGRAGAA